jgi:Fe-S-cluster containining protein
MTMPERKKFFLTLDEARDAIACDFFQYPDQLKLLASLVPLVFGDDAYLIQEPNGRKVWLKSSRLKKPTPLPVDQLGEFILKQLDRQLPTLEHMARICTRVFQTPVMPARSKNGQSLPGLWVQSGMDDFVCLQCGRCCRKLTYKDGCTVADYRRWVELGRTDILAWVGTVKQDGVVAACRIWMVPGTNRYADSCPWLKRGDNPTRYICTIHDVRPTICRQYPGTRKHARMTGCRAF